MKKQKRTCTRREMLRLSSAGLLEAGIALSSAAAAPRRTLAYRWVYIQCNLQVDAEVVRLKGILQRAAAAGYNGIVLSDYKFGFLDRVIPVYFQNAQAVLQSAKQLGLKVYTTVCPIGYSNELLVNDPNLAEGLPVREATYRVQGREAILVPSAKASLTNGDFREASGNTLVGWSFQDNPGDSTFVDSAVERNGLPSLRIEESKHRNARIMQTVSVAPWRQMRLSVWAKTADFQGGDQVGSVVLGADGKSLGYMQWDFAPNQDWRQYSVVFNTLQNRQINVYLGVWGGRGGKLWFNGARLEDVGLLNVLRRDGCPLEVRGETGQLYREGADFEPISDPFLMKSPGDYDIQHEPPNIRLTQQSRISDGERLLVSFYHPVPIYGWAVSCCLTAPKVYALLRHQLELVQRCFHPGGFFFAHDEMRVANWCRLCRATHKTPGQLLADNIQRCAEMARAVNPQAEQFVWSDMFDPYHNAVADYYLVNGSLTHSWDGLPKQMIIVNWNRDHDKQSLSWFGDRGVKQILAGYYDGPPESIRDWLQDARGVAGVVGVMYTTWQQRFDDLEAFAKAAWG